MAGFGFSFGKSAVEWTVLLYLYWLGVEFTPQFLSRETLNAIYFPNLRIALRSYFFARKLMEIVIEKSCVIMENWNQTLCWKSFLGKFSVKSKTETKLCGKLKTEPNFVDKCCVEFFSSWKYNTVCNIGLFQVARLVITQNDVV